MRWVLILVSIVTAGCTASEPAQIPSTPATCGKIALRVEPPRLDAGAEVVVEETITNCGESVLEIPPTNRCSTGFRVEASGPQDFLLDHSGAAGNVAYDRAFWGVSAGPCRLVQSTTAPRYSLAPHASQSERFHLNGTTARRAWCPAGNGGVSFCDEPNPLPPGAYTLYANWSDSRATATLVVNSTSWVRNTTRVLEIRETDWLNGTGNATLPAEFGPPCPPARLDDAKLERFSYGALLPPSTPWTVLRSFEGKPNHTTSSGGNLQLIGVDSGGTWLASPWSATDSVLQFTPLRDGRVYAEGTLIPVGGTGTIRVERDMPPLHQTSVLVIRNVGELQLTTQDVANGCP